LSCKTDATTDCSLASSATSTRHSSACSKVKAPRHCSQATICGFLAIGFSRPRVRRPQKGRGRDHTECSACGGAAWLDKITHVLSSLCVVHYGQRLSELPQYFLCKTIA
jgi:hypothetical protein